ncbi:TetR/AcrR family transcriptional regulator [Tropicimonas sp. S265A]|uniref:TetR/AcrR family transcriptional regulator n=1 Tax=Tropicimonas sp. S265A TaxID=3415134 RepID=UPI003C7EB888
MNADPGIKRGRKFDAVLRGARTVFLRDGFEGASVDDIARAAQVSKATLYNYFPDKRLLFLEVARTEIASVTDHAMEVIDRTKPPASVLKAAAHTIIGFNISAMGLAIYRLCVAEAERFPELGRAFYDAGAVTGRAAIIEYFNEAMARGELVIHDTRLAADQFFELCRADLQLRLLLGVSEVAEPVEVERIAQGAVDMFLARYATA